MKKLTLEQKKEAPNVVPFQSLYNHISPMDLDNMMESLIDNGYLSDRGVAFKSAFWNMFIKEI